MALFQNSLQKKLKEISAHFFQDKYEKALKEAMAVSASRPGDMRARLRVAELFFKTKKLDRAIEIYHAVASQFIQENFILKAVAIYKNILKLDPSRVEINLKLAELYQKLEMISDAANQYRIAIQLYGTKNQRDKIVDICKKLVDLDPSNLNRKKLGEIYQANGMTNEAIEQYEILANNFKQAKEYDDLMRIYELILPHKPDNKAIIKDLMILYLRSKNPDSALRLLEKQKMDAEPEFKDLVEKAKLMKKALRTSKS